MKLYRLMGKRPLTSKTSSTPCPATSVTPIPSYSFACTYHGWVMVPINLGGGRTLQVSARQAMISLAKKVGDSQLALRPVGEQSTATLSPAEIVVDSKVTVNDQPLFCADSDSLICVVMTGNVAVISAFTYGQDKKRGVGCDVFRISGDATDAKQFSQAVTNCILNSKQKSNFTALSTVSKISTVSASGKIGKPNKTSKKNKPPVKIRKKRRRRGSGDQFQKLFGDLSVDDGSKSSYNTNANAIADNLHTINDGNGYVDVEDASANGYLDVSVDNELADDEPPTSDQYIVHGGDDSVGYIAVQTRP